DRGTELQHPAPHRFVGDVEPSRGQQLLDIAVAQGEAEIEPDRVLDNLSWEPVAAVAERSHPTSYPMRRWLPTRFCDNAHRSQDGLRRRVTLPRSVLRVGLNRTRRRPLSCRLHAALRNRGCPDRDNGECRNKTRSTSPRGTNVSRCWPLRRALRAPK